MPGSAPEPTGRGAAERLRVAPPEGFLAEELERLQRALQEAPDRTLARTLQAAGEALRACFAAVLGPPPPREPAGPGRILAHWGLRPQWALALCAAGEPLSRPGPVRIVAGEPDFPLASEPDCRSLACVPLADLPGTRLVIGAGEAERFGPPERALLDLLGRLLGALVHEGALRREKGRLEESLAERIQAGAGLEALLDREGRVVAASPRLERLLGAEEGGLVGLCAARFLLGRPGAIPGGPRSRGLARRAARKGRGRALLATPGGEEVPVRLEVRRLCAGRWHADLHAEETGGGQGLGEARFLALGIWSAGLARELTQLMAGALGGASLALKELPPGHPASQALGLLEERAWRAARLAQQALELAHPDVLEGPLDPVALVHEASLLAGLSLPDGIPIQLCGPLPPLAGSASVFRLLLHTALLSAACAAPGGPVGVTLQPPGPGPDPESWSPGPPSGAGLLLRVERKGRLAEGPESPSPEHCGLAAAAQRGPELEALVRRLAAAMGGAAACPIDAQRRKSIHLFLPSSPSPAEEPAGARTVPRGARSETLLLVEGEEAVLRAGRESLEEEGHAVLSARDGLEAVALFQRRHEEIGLAILDLSLPRLGGVEVLRQMRKTDPELKVLVTSGYGEAITRQALAGLGVEGFLRKPYGQAALIRKVSECLAL